eukprot:scaffold16499_cov121-Isochrysis_galbana.AAC.7
MGFAICLSLAYGRWPSYMAIHMVTQSCSELLLAAHRQLPSPSPSSSARLLCVSPLPSTPRPSCLLASPPASAATMSRLRSGS